MANIPGAVTDPSRVHGEEIEFKSGNDTIKGYLARPSEPSRYPGIVVIHEAFGLVEHIRDIARRFANIGYNALAPDLYHRSGSPDPNNMESVFPVMFGLPDAQAVGDFEASAAHLRALSGATGKIGAIGFCSGGRQTLLFACSSRSSRCSARRTKIRRWRYQRSCEAARSVPARRSRSRSTRTPGTLSSPTIGRATVKRRPPSSGATPSRSSTNI